MYLVFVKSHLFVGNPFFEAYFNSDFLGKAIFIALIIISVGTWALLIHKVFLTRKAKNASSLFKKNIFRKKRADSCYRRY